MITDLVNFNIGVEQISIVGSNKVVVNIQEIIKCERKTIMESNFFHNLDHP